MDGTFEGIASPSSLMDVVPGNGLSIPASPVSECILWTGKLDPKGYGFFCADGGRVASHRWAYERANGRIENGLVVDHLCRTPACVNPEHMELVSHRTNILRGTAPSAENARKSHCKRGHEFTRKNTRRNKRGGRVCMECSRMATRAFYRRTIDDKRESVNEKNRKWRAANPEKLKESQRDSYRRMKAAGVESLPRYQHRTGRIELSCGHPMTDKNVHMRVGGPYCRMCDRDRAAAKRNRLRAEGN